MPTLVDKLTTAAADAIAAERRVIESDPKKLRSITVELVLGTGQQIQATCYAEHRHRLNGSVR